MRKSFFFPKAWEFYRDGTFTGFALRVQEPCRCFRDCRAAAHARMVQNCARRPFAAVLFRRCVKMFSNRSCFAGKILT
jgi:hypothetical protein